MTGIGSAANVRRPLVLRALSGSVSRTAVCLLATAAGLSCDPAAAQRSNASTANDRQEQGIFDEIVVTAERRATSLQSTPISIIAVTGEGIAQKGISDLQDLSHFTPNLNVSPGRGGGSNQPIFEIRGIAGGQTGTSERGVGLYIDGIYMPRTSGSVMRVLDVDRIEVLRGPQGTLFGRNSTGGAVRIFTKQPELGVTSGYVRGTIANMDRYDVEALANLPLGEGAAMRVQFARLQQGGYVSRGDQMLGASTNYVGRAQIRLDLSDKLTALGGFLYSKDKMNGTPLVLREFDMRPGIQGVLEGNYADYLNDAFKAAGQAPLAPYNDPRLVKGRFHAPDICLLDNFNPDYSSQCDQFNNNEYIQGNLSLVYTISDTVKLTSLSGASKLHHNATSDWQLIGDEFRADVINSSVLYQELQMNAALFDHAVDLVAGGTYFREGVNSPGHNINRKSTSVYPAAANGNADAGLFRVQDQITNQISNSYGLFANATWHVTHSLNLTGGLRYAYDRKFYTQTRFPATDFKPAPGTTSTTVAARHHWDALDYRVSLDYKFTPDIMAYVTTSKAYKAGQFSYTIQSWTIANQATGAAQSALIKPVPPEKVVNYEAGIRSTLLGGRLRFNPTIFYMPYTNRQAATQVTCTSINLPASQCPTGFVIQITDQGNVDLYGVEVDGQLAIVDGLVLDGALGITKYKLKNAPAGTVYLYPATPSLTFNVGATYKLDRAFGRFTFNINYAYVGHQPTYPQAVVDSFYELPAYGLANARVQFAPTDKRYSISLFVNNLLDNTYSTYAQRFGGGFWDSPVPTGVAAPNRSALAEDRGRPREFGVTAQINF